MDVQVSTFLSSGAACLLVMLVATRLLKSYLSSYVEEKGKNLATKEDVGAITREVERVRHDYSALLEQMKARNQLRMAALDKRLQVHQEAFTNWRRVYMSEPDQFEAEIKRCRDWWNLNCIYLEPKVRDGYLDALNHEYVYRARRTGGDFAAALSDHMGRMFAFPNLLFEAIQLPPLTGIEKSELQAKPPVHT
jgi:hypothetical protein